jgi:hypothetical protein
VRVWARPRAAAPASIPHALPPPSDTAHPTPSLDYATILQRVRRAQLVGRALIGGLVLSVALMLARGLLRASVAAA